MTRETANYGEMVGETYGYLVVKKLLPREKNSKGIMKKATVECYCKVCGSTTIQTATLLLSGHKSSCGCLNRSKRGWNYYFYKAKTIECMVGKPIRVETEQKPKKKLGRPPEKSWIRAKMHAIYICETPDEVCMRSKIAQLCCCECDKRSRCGMACKCTPDKCGAKKRGRRE